MFDLPHFSMPIERLAINYCVQKVIKVKCIIYEVV